MARRAGRHRRVRGRDCQRIPGDDGLDAYGHIAYLINQFDCLDSNTLFWGGYDRKLLSQAAEVMVTLTRRSEPRSIAAALHDCRRTMRRLSGFGRSSVPTVIRRESGPGPGCGGNSFHWCDAPEIPTGEANWVWGTQFHYGNIAFGPDSQHVWCGNGAPIAVTLLDLQTRQVAAALRHRAARWAS